MLVMRTRHPPRSRAPPDVRRAEDAVNQCRLTKRTRRRVWPTGNLGMKYCDALVQHYENAWARPGKACVWPHGPVWDLPKGFHVRRFGPAGARPAWTYATVCMSQEEDESRLELHLLSRIETVEHVELLTIIAHYHRTGARLGLGHTVNFGRPWLPQSRCTYGLISLPYLDGPKLEILDLGTMKVRFLWLIPVTEQEVEYKKKHGIEALEAKFEDAKFDYLDPYRDSVVAP